MIVAVFYRQRSDGAWYARCETFPGWTGVTGATFEDAARQALESLRGYLARELRVAHYKLEEVGI